MSSFDVCVQADFDSLDGQFVLVDPTFADPDYEYFPCLIGNLSQMRQVFIFCILLALIFVNLHKKLRQAKRREKKNLCEFHIFAKNALQFLAINKIALTIFAISV